MVKTGLGGYHGNKGGIGIRFMIDDSSFCFVNSHVKITVRYFLPLKK